MAFQFLVVATSPPTNGILWQKSKVKVTQKIDYSKIKVHSSNLVLARQGLQNYQKIEKSSKMED